MNTYSILQMILAAILIGSIILQSRGSTNGMTFGGSGETYRAKKGIERVLFYSTIVSAALFAAVSVIALIS